jgi:sugar/nucleoside kinase (ribokinase family)
MNANGSSILVSGRLYLELAVEQARDRHRHERPAQWHHAGNGGHMAAAAARLGASVALFTQVGLTAHDDDMLHTLAGDGVDVSCVIRRAAQTTSRHVHAEQHGAQQTTTLSLPSHCGLTEHDVDAADPLLLAHQWLLAEPMLPPAFLDRLIESAGTYGMHTALCVVHLPEQRLPRRLWDKLDYLVINQSSLEALARKAHWPAQVLPDPVAVCRMFPALRGLVLLRGAHEMQVADAQRAVCLPLTQDEDVYARGMGAVAAAALVVALAEGRTLAHAGRLAHAAVRFYLAHDGTRAAMPFKKELDWRDPTTTNGAQGAV